MWTKNSKFKRGLFDKITDSYGYFRGLENFPKWFSPTWIIFQNEAFNQWLRRLRSIAISHSENFRLVFKRIFFISLFMAHFVAFNSIIGHMDWRTAEMLVGRNLKPPPFFTKARLSKPPRRGKKENTEKWKPVSLATVPFQLVKCALIIWTYKRLSKWLFKLPQLTLNNISLTLKRAWKEKHSSILTCTR